MRIPKEIYQFVRDCEVLARDKDHSKISGLLQDLIATPERLAASVPKFPQVEPSPDGWRVGGEQICHRSAELTVMIADTLPGVLGPPHQHEMHAIIGVFEGCEFQRFFTRRNDRLIPSSSRQLVAGSVMTLGTDAIHAISSPPDNAARALHVYLGDLYATDRLLFHPETLQPHRFTLDRYSEFCRLDGDPTAQSSA